MIDKDDWRLLNDADCLRDQYLDPVSSNEIILHLPELKHCVFCLEQLPEQLSYYERWYITPDRKNCVCESCFNDFREYFNLKSTDGWDVEWD